jgi:hypothetical protein
LSAQPTQEWVARYERPSGSSAIANQMALDKVGNCYVLGNRPVSGGIGGILTIKYNSNGDTVWTRTYNIGSGNAAVNTAITADSVGNVYVLGYIGPTFGPYDIVLVKYNTSGQQQWIKTYLSSFPGDVALDNTGNIYVCGGIGNSALLIKYNSNGDTIWTRTYNIAGNGSGAGHIKVNGQGYVYLGGSSRNISTNQYYFLALKYDSNGIYQWHNTYTSTGFETMRAMTIDVFGNCYLAGNGSDGVTDGGLTIKYSPSGVQLWLRVLRYAQGTNANDIITDINGNIYVTGAYTLGGGNFNYFTIKYNTIGDSNWVRTYNGSANDNDEAYSVALDDLNDIYVTGRSINSSSSWDYTTIKYDSNGIQKWIQIYNNQTVNAEDVANKIILDKNKNIYVSGLSKGVVGGPLDYVTIKYSQTVGIWPVSNIIPDEYTLEQNYPNPFNPKTKIIYQMPKSGNVKLIVYNLLGSQLTVLENGYKQAGIYTLDFDASNQSSGIYFYKLITENYIETRKMILVK